MRSLKVSTNQMKQLIADTLETLMSGASSITLKLEELLKLPSPKGTKPTVIFTEVAQRKIQALIQECDKEIAWHGLVDREGDTYIVKDILVYPQFVTGVTVTSDDELYPLWLDELDDDVFNAIRLQGHSHVNMSTSPSAVDTTYYNNLTKHINDYYIFIILNKSNKLWINLYDMVHQVVYETPDINVKYAGVNYTAWAKKEIEEYLDEPSLTIPTVGGRHISVDQYLGYRSRLGDY